MHGQNGLHDVRTDLKLREVLLPITRFVPSHLKSYFIIHQFYSQIFKDIQVFFYFSFTMVIKRSLGGNLQVASSLEPRPSSPPDLRPSGRGSSRRSQIRWWWGPGFEARWRAANIRNPATCMSGVNSDLDSRMVPVETRAVNFLHAQAGINRSKCIRIIRIASTGLWPQEMFTFLKCMQMVEMSPTREGGLSWKHCRFGAVQKPGCVCVSEKDER